MIGWNPTTHKNGICVIWKKDTQNIYAFTISDLDFENGLILGVSETYPLTLPASFNVFNVDTPVIARVITDDVGVQEFVGKVFHD